MPNKRNNYINPEGGRRKPTFGYTKDNGTTMRHVLILLKKNQKRCEEMKNRKNRKGRRREIKIRGFKRLNSSHKVPFRIKVKWNITIRNPMDKVQKGRPRLFINGPDHAYPKNWYDIKRHLKKDKWHVEKTVETHAYSPLAISHIMRRIDSYTQIHPRDRAIRSNT